MRRLLCVLAAILGGCGLTPPVWAEWVQIDEAFPPGADSVCGIKGGLTAISRLPPVRIVVFDPISNSFAFIACRPVKEKDRITISNQDFLDRHRFALTTQKIRLLILPYNPADGNLILEKVDGEGVEFSDIVGGSLPPVRSTMPTPTSDDQPPVQETPSRPELMNQAVEERTRPITQRIAADPSGRTLTAEGDKNQSDSNLAVLEFLSRDYSRRADAVNQVLQGLRLQKRCIGASLKSAPLSLTQELARLPEPFSLKRDVTLEEVEAEMRRRLDLITRDFYTPCRIDPEAREQDFRSDIMAFDRIASEQVIAIDRLRWLTREISQLGRRMSATKPSEISFETWRLYLDSMRKFEEQIEAFNGDLASSLDEILRSADQFRSEHDSFQSARNSPAMQIQRFNYSPLGEGKSITLTIRRGAAQPNDPPNVPTRVASLEIKSAPVHVMRFAMGLVASRLRNPSFEAVAFPTEEATQPTANREEEPGDDSEPATKNVLLLKDEGDGEALPGLFLHHYWGRRSPLLEPTVFERWMPTLSLGIPVSEAQALTQFFLGLDWQLVPGFELNVGYHFGKVNALEDGYRVGQVIPVDATALQKEKFGSAVYFGIAVNRDAFERIFQNGED